MADKPKQAPAPKPAQVDQDLAAMRKAFNARKAKKTEPKK